MSTHEFHHQISNLHPVVRTFTRRFTSDRDEALDLAQDTILRALTNSEKFRKDTNLQGWLFTIMRNTFINSYHKGQRLKISNDRSSELAIMNVEDTYTFNGPATNLEYSDIRKQVSTLRDELLVPFEMYASGYKYHEIAEHENIPLGTVKNRIFQARKEIQKGLADY